MPTRKKLTDRTLKALKPARKGQRVEIYDSIVPPLMARVTDTGHVSFALFARVPGRAGKPVPARLALGSYPALSLERARDKAGDWLNLIEKGKDPREVEKAERAAEARENAGTFRAVAEDFIKRHASKLAKRDVETVVRRELLGQERRDGEWVEGNDPRWGERHISDIARADVVEVIERIMDRKAPSQAHHTFSAIRKLFNWAIGNGKFGIETSPCDRISPVDLIGHQNLRKRVLTDDELRALWKATDAMGYPFGDVIRLLILTGQRKSEVAEARWSEFDLENAVWTIPADRMKADAAHVVPLPSRTVEILKALPRFKGPFVFTTTAGRRPVSGFSKAKTRADKFTLDALAAEAAGGDVGNVTMEPWVFHDIRRTVRTHFSALPASDIVRELAIAHTQKGLHKVYDQWAYLDEKRTLFEGWAARLRDIVEPPPDNVARISLVRGKA